MIAFFQVIVDGLLNGMIYALVAAGLSLIWGVMDVINFAQGEFLMASMYLTFFMGFFLKIDPLISWIASGIFGFLLGIFTYKLVVGRCLKKAHMAPLLATFGLSIVLKNLCLYFFSPNFRILKDFYLDGKKLNIFGVIIPFPQLITGLFSVIVVFLLYLLIKKTRLGWAIQATAMDREAAELVGINTSMILTLVFGLSSACVGIAGGLLPNFLATHPEVGTMFSLLAFVSVALGGFGSISGAFLASILIGLVESFAGFYLAPVFKYVAVFGMYLVVILIKPKGLFGW